ncbi:nucleotide pyrophosphohydrolase [Kaarinaea lacus]
MATRNPQVKEVMDRLLDRVMVEDPVDDIKHRLRKFVAERDWQQFNTPKNLSMALIAEAGELVEHFQWLTDEQSKNLDGDQLKAVSHELADIFIYLLRLADELNIDLIKATNEKMLINNKKYPAEKVKGSANKYTYYD